MIDDKTQDYTVMNGLWYFSHHFLSSLCETAYLNKRQEDSDLGEFMQRSTKTRLP